MKRMLSALLASAALFSFTAPSFADASTMSKMSMKAGNAVHVCPKHSMWVKGYTKKNGAVVKGYCRHM